jgi:hypothetical protein
MTDNIMTQHNNSTMAACKVAQINRNMPLDELSLDFDVVDHPLDDTEKEVLKTPDGELKMPPSTSLDDSSYSEQSLCILRSSLSSRLKLKSCSIDRQKLGWHFFQSFFLFLMCGTNRAARKLHILLIVFGLRGLWRNN